MIDDDRYDTDLEPCTVAVRKILRKGRDVPLPEVACVAYIQFLAAVALGRIEPRAII